jgi:hypothetical protein
MADLFARYQEKEPVPLMVWALLTSAGTQTLPPVGS